MAYRYPYGEELRKAPLNPDMIRHRVRRDAKQLLVTGLMTGIPIAVLFGGVLAIFCFLYPWRPHAASILLGGLGALAFAVAALIGILLAAETLRNHCRALRGEVSIEIDKFSYVEHDRPRVVHHKRHTHVVYEDFLHFASGREFKDEEQKYRHMDIEGEEFIIVAYTAAHDSILYIYRLSDYNWQP